MTTAPLDDFAARLVRLVRDAAIKSCDRSFASPSSPVGKRWQGATARNDLAHAMISDCVDETIFWLLQVIDQEELKLVYMSDQGENVDLCQDGQGELSGWYMGSGGWRSRYSAQRYQDDFGDLA